MFDLEFAPQGTSQEEPSGEGYRGVDCPLCGNPIVDQAPKSDRFILVEGTRIVVHATSCVSGPYPAHWPRVCEQLPKAA